MKRFLIGLVVLFSLSGCAALMAPAGGRPVAVAKVTPTTVPTSAPTVEPTLVPPTNVPIEVPTLAPTKVLLRPCALENETFTVTVRSLVEYTAWSTRLER